MRHSKLSCALLLAATGLVPACSEGASERPAAGNERSCDAPGAREVVERFGERLKQVSLLAPDRIVVQEIRDAYAPFVTPTLLDAWIAEPSGAPGRQVSSPWPERIEVGSVEPAATGLCRVEGEVVYVTSADAGRGGETARERVTLRVRTTGGLARGGRDGDDWRISTFELGAVPPPASTSAAAAADVVRRYYAAIEARDYRRAYESWAADGTASGQTFEEFAAGFTETTSIAIEIGAPGRVEPAAGSRYVEVPVVIRAVTATGEERRFEGTYTLRRSVVDGATAAQRRWHLYSAEIARIR
ncbi:MAG: hypothetical protein ACRELC_03695 [Gemmatimonadota bacterium]